MPSTLFRSMSDSEEKTWLENLRVNDVVIIDHSMSDVLTSTRVARITKTLIITTSNSRFRRDDGRQPGESFSKSHLLQPTQERLERILRDRLANKLKRVDWRHAPLKKLQAVDAILNDMQIPT